MGGLKKRIQAANQLCLSYNRFWINCYSSLFRPSVWQHTETKVRLQRNKPAAVLKSPQIPLLEPGPHEGSTHSLSLNLTEYSGHSKAPHPRPCSAKCSAASLHCWITQASSLAPTTEKDSSYLLASPPHAPQGMMVPEWVESGAKGPFRKLSLA